MAATYNWYTDRTEAEWAAEAAMFRQRAADCRHRSAESWERSDTDGFLSQWASDSMARHYDLCAELCDTQGEREMNALFDLDGNLVSTRIIDTQYGSAWLTTEEHVKSGGRQFVNPSHARKGVTRYRNLKAKGYTIGTILVRCGVFSRAGGAMQVYDVIEPLREATNIKIISTDNGIGEDWK